MQLARATSNIIQALTYERPPNIYLGPAVD